MPTVCEERGKGDRSLWEIYLVMSTAEQSLYSQALTESGCRIIGEFGIPLFGISAIPVSLGLLLAAETYLVGIKQLSNSDAKHSRQQMADYLKQHALCVEVADDGSKSYSVSPASSTEDGTAMRWAGAIIGAGLGAIFGPFIEAAAIGGGIAGAMIAPEASGDSGAITDTPLIENPEPVKAVQDVVVENKQGTVVYQIQNLNIYLTAEVVHQLNINPKEVINQIKDQLREDITKITESHT